jgi:hypothetical protein
MYLLKKDSFGQGLVADADARVDGDLEVLGSITAEDGVLPVDGNLTVNGTLTVGAGYSVAQSVASAVTAAGTTITDAFQLAAVYNRVTTVAASTGVKLWTPAIGSAIWVQNLGASNLNVYPPTASGNINGLGAGTPVTLAAASDGIAVFILVATNVWMSLEGTSAA